MKNNAGVWIDHREAVIVMLSEAGHETKRILSGAEKHPRRASPPSEGRFKGHEAPADDSREIRFDAQLARFYDLIIAALRDRHSILIFGPGEAKEELLRRFDAHKGERRTCSSLTAGRMTELQVVAQVRSHFHAEAARREG